MASDLFSHVLSLNTLAWFAAFLGVLFAVLQVAKTLRVQTTSGVSLVSWSAMSLGSGLWLSYGFVNGIPQQIAANAPWILAEVVLGIFLLRDQRVNRFAILLPVLAIPFFALAHVLTPSLLLPLALILRVFFEIPQARSSFLSRDRRGVSVSAWVLGSISGVCWVAYGLGVGVPAMWGTALLGLVMSLTNVLVLLSRPVVESNPNLATV